MALPSYAMGSYGLLFRTKDGLFDIIDSAVAVAASRWPDDLQRLRDQILKKLGLDSSPNDDQKKTKKEELSSAPALSAKEKKAPAVAPRQPKAARDGQEISAEIVVSNSNRRDDVGRGGRVNIEVKLRRPSTKNSSAKEAEARDKPRESSLEEKRKLDGDQVLGFAREERGRGAGAPRKEESYAVRGGGDSRGRRMEEAADYYQQRGDAGRRVEVAADHYQRRRRSEDWHHGDRKINFGHDDRYYGGRSKDGHYGGRKRNFDNDRRRHCARSEDRCYGGRKRDFDHEERRYEEERSRKRRRIVEEASATTTTGNHGVIQYSRRFLLSMRPRD